MGTEDAHKDSGLGRVCRRCGCDELFEGMTDECCPTTTGRMCVFDGAQTSPTGSGLSIGFKSQDLVGRKTGRKKRSIS